MTRRFAEGTTVSTEKTRAELDRLLSQHGATQRATYVDDETGIARVQFSLAGRMVRLELSTAAPKLELPSGSWRWPEAKKRDYRLKRQEQFAREAWRRLLLVVKAKLELVKDGVTTVEREFLADVLLPDGQTVHQALEKRIADAYDTGAMPKLLGDGT